MEDFTTIFNSGNEYELAIINKNVSSTNIGRVMVCISIPQEASEEVKLESGRNQSWKRQCTQKVPAILRREEHNKWEYDPAVVSLGPYHHGKDYLKLTEDFKPKALELYAAGSGMDTSCLYTKVVEVIDDLRRCYVENSTDQYDDAVFARMMLRDACFIINYIHVTLTYHKEMLEASIDHLGMLAFKLTLRDMFLLENQIPLWFLKIFMYLKYGEKEGEEMLNRFLNITLFGEYKQKGESNKKDEEPFHLLEAFRGILVADCCKHDVETKQYWSLPRWLSLKTARIGKTWQCHSLLKSRLFSKREKIYNGRNIKNYVHSFRSVRDLKAKGIQFRPSPTDCLKDVKFKASCFRGELHLPTWCVSVYTKVLLLNMVAFEMCPNTSTDQTVSTFINFVKSLIESPEDVKELREKQIITHMLGSDDEVVQVYKNINTYGVNNYALFHETREKIKEHYNCKAKTWAAELIHTYFRSPWTAIALLAAVFLLCMTFLQTYFTIYPSRNK